MKQPPKLATASDNPPTFSGFKELSSLAVLDMDTLDHIPELTKCILNSACTLKRLELSISEGLALKARKPGAPQDSDEETDPDIDEIDNVWVAPPPLPPPPAALGLGPLPPANDADIRKERLAQENILARLFGLENLSSESQKLNKDTESIEVKPKEEARKQFLKDLSALMSKLVMTAALHSGNNFKPQKMLDMVEKAAEKYLNATDTAGGSSSNGTGNVPLQGKKKPTSKKKLAAPHKMAAPLHLLGVAPSSSDPMVGVPTSYSLQYSNMSSKNIHSSAVKHQKSLDKPPQFSSSSWDVGPSDIDTASTVPNKSGAGSSWSTTIAEDIYYANGVDPINVGNATSKGKAKLVEAAHSTASPESSNQIEDDSDGPGLFDDPTNSMKPSTRLHKEMDVADDIDISHPDVDALEEGDDQEMVESSEVATNGDMNRAEITEELSRSPGLPVLTNGTATTKNVSEREIDSESNERKDPITTGADVLTLNSTEQSPEQAMHDYVRAAHGLGLEHLALYLIPIKASVLSRAVDLATLKSITLLNVGPQGGFWSAMAKRHLDTPLQLKVIHTDNVTNSFLSFVNGLEGLTELYMLERSTKARVESLAPTTVVGIEDIRRQALRKHMRTLKRLMIKNENDIDHSWDINGKTMRLITARGGKLRELAMSLDSRSSVNHLDLPTFNVLYTKQAM